MLQHFTEAVEQGSLLAFGLAFVGGILASLTPCVYPVLPITVSFFAGRAKSHFHAVWLSIVYVSGMAVVYAALGIFAGLTSKVFGRITMNAPVYVTAGAVVVLFGLLQMEWLKIKIPVLNMGRARNGWKGSAFVMGMTSGFIVAPCTVPVLGVILTYIAAKQSILYGASLMFVFAWGLGFLLMLLGIFTNALTRLPKSGQWLVVIEKTAGLLFLAIGAYFIYRGFMFLI